MLIKVKVFPDSKESKIIQKSNDSFEAKIRAKARRGEANKELFQILANFFKISPSEIRLVKGGKQRSKIFKVPDSLNQVEKAVNILKKGGIIAYPTDTVYGIGCNIFEEKAVRKVFNLKGREFSNPLSVAVSDFEMLQSLVFINKNEEDILRKILPGPVTIILPKKPIVSDLVTAGKFSLGIRIPDYDLIREMIRKAKFPIVSTSANISGKEPPTSPEKVALKVDFVLRGNCRHKKFSTVIDWKERKIIREGAGLEKIKSLLGF